MKKFVAILMLCLLPITGCECTIQSGKITPSTKWVKLDEHLYYQDFEIEGENFRVFTQNPTNSMSGLTVEKLDNAQD